MSTDNANAARRGSESNDLLGLAPERAAFEAWFGEDGKWPSAVRRSGEGYTLAAAQSAWVAWRAAWATSTNRCAAVAAKYGRSDSCVAQQIADEILRA